MSIQPAIYKREELYVLPRPIRSIRVQDRFDSARFKVPLRHGDFATGFSRGGVEILIEGDIAVQQEQLLLSEAEMLDEIKRLREMLTQTSDTDKYLLYLGKTSEGNYSHWYQDCSTSRFECDLTNSHLFSYQLVIHAEDPVLYTAV